MSYAYKISMTRKTYDNLCSFLQYWGEVYSQPNAVILRGSLRKDRKRECRQALGIVSAFTASELAAHFATALHALGQALTRKADAVVDLRDLSEEELESLTFVVDNAKLKVQQRNALRRLTEELTRFQNLPEMVRIALATVD